MGSLRARQRGSVCAGSRDMAREGGPCGGKAPPFMVSVTTRTEGTVVQIARTELTQDQAFGVGDVLTLFICP